MAHTLTGYDGACSQIHGHSYRLFVTVTGEPAADAGDPKYGMVMDFRSLKKIIGDHILEPFDHSMMIRRTAANGKIIDTLKGEFSKIHEVEYQPTCENLISYFARIISAALPGEVRLHSLKLHETATSYAEWFASDN